MSETPNPDDPHRDSVPLLLARTTGRIRVEREEALDRERELESQGRASRLPTTREVRKVIRIVRGSLGTAGALVAALLVMCAIFAELLASDLPLACNIHGKTWILPAVVQPAELVEMGGARVAREATWSVGALVPHGPKVPVREPSATGNAAKPGNGHPFGTDRQGRDVFARVVHGTRSCLAFAAAAVFASLLLGGLLGALAGLFGGATDALVGRAIESVSAFPPLVLVLGVQAAVPRATMATLFLAIALTRWPEVARLVRAEVMQVATRDYVLAARALGASPWRVLRRHIAPHVRGQLAVLGAVGVPAVVLIEASLDFLRFGVPPGATSWGETMSEFRDAPHAWWLLAFPGMFIFATVVALTLVGEARRDSLDPHAR